MLIPSKSRKSSSLITADDGHGGTFGKTFTVPVKDNPNWPTPQPNHDGTVTVSGTAKVGETLSATVADEDGVPTDGVKYQWLRDGNPINHATQDKYTLTKDDLGHKISVQATYEDNGKHQESPKSAETDAVSDGQTPPNPNPNPQPQPNHEGTVTVSGTAKVGENAQRDRRR